MGVILVEGGRRLSGALTVQGAKNSVLPMLAATVLCGGCCRLRGCPRLSDVEAAAEIIRHLGGKTAWEGSDLLVDTRGLSRCEIPAALMHRMRSSIVFLGAMLARFGQAQCCAPGGCVLGPRPIDLHLSALRALGAAVREEENSLTCQAPHLRGAEIRLRFPSVGATENAMLAACGAEGVTVISNAAREPEIVELQAFLQQMGACVQGAGTSAVVVEGKKPLHGCCHTVGSDRMVAATYLCAAAATGGDVYLRRADYRQLSAVLCALQQSGCVVCSDGCGIRLKGSGRLRAVPPVCTSPYPGFPTDAQAVFMAALLKSRGSTVFTENIFSDRYRHVPYMQRMGADIRAEGRTAIVTGTEQLCGAAVEATDLRGGAALVVAGLQAEGITEVRQIQHIERGYGNLPGDLKSLGALVTYQEKEQ